MAVDEDFENLIARAKARRDEISAKFAQEEKEFKVQFGILESKGALGFFRGLSLPMRIGIVAVACALAFVVVASIADKVGTWRYGKELAASTAKAEAKEKEAAELKAFSDDLLLKSNEKSATIEALQKRINEAQAQLAEQNQQLVSLSVQTVAAKGNYAKAKTNPRIDMYLSGNDDADRQRLFAEYQKLKSEAGH